jgi:hypothetical protein
MLGSMLGLRWLPLQQQQLLLLWHLPFHNIKSSTSMQAESEPHYSSRLMAHHVSQAAAAAAATRSRCCPPHWHRLRAGPQTATYSASSSSGSSSQGVWSGRPLYSQRT